MKYAPMHKPTDPGFYWVAGQEGEPRLVEVCIESDSFNLYYILLPGDDRKHALEDWPAAIWFGPLDPGEILDGLER